MAEQDTYHKMRRLQAAGARFAIVDGVLTFERNAPREVQNFVSHHGGEIRAILLAEAELDRRKLESRRLGYVAGFWKS